MAVVIVLDIVLSLGLFGVLQYQQTTIDSNRAKVGCYAHLFDRAVLGHPTHAQLETEARRCAKLP